MKAHTNQEIITKALAEPKDQATLTNNNLDIAVDLEDEHGIMHTYVVTLRKEGESWLPLDVSEVSSI